MNNRNDHASKNVERYISPLRRYARMLTGSQEEGDEYVRLTLELVRAEPHRLQGTDLRMQLYRTFHMVRTAIEWAASPDRVATTYEDRLESNLATLEPLGRQVLILAVVERFSYEQIGFILDLSVDHVRERLSEARARLAHNVSLPVLIIEDEHLIAMGLEQTLTEMGLKVTGIVAREEDARTTVEDEHPRLIISDIRLKDDGSGLRAAQFILEKYEVPIVFVTGFPERLLTGHTLEPAFVVAKPFTTEELKITVAQALATYSKNAQAADHRRKLLTKLKDLNGSRVAQFGVK